MLEYIVIFIIVGIAGYFTIKRLVQDATGSQCESCTCECNTQAKILEIAKIAEKSSDKRDINGN